MPITKATRQQVHDKYNGHCAYCGKVIQIRDMQIDHIKPKRAGGTDDIKNRNPACRRCNHYKRANSLAVFRKLLITLHERVRQQYICKVAEDYGVIRVEPWDGKFYYEGVAGND